MNASRRVGEKFALAHTLLAHLYLTTAEPILEFKTASAGIEVDDDDNDGPRSQVTGSTYLWARELLGDWRPDQDISEILATDAQKLPVRHLPPGPTSTLHWQILAWRDAQACQRLSNRAIGQLGGVTPRNGSAA